MVSSSYSPLSTTTSTNHRRCRSVCGMLCLLITIALTLALAISVIYIFMIYPAHASCSVQWTFDDDCTSVGEKIESQIHNWTTPICKDKSMKCLYQLEFANESLIEGTHTTPKFKFVDSFQFQLNEVNNTCQVGGFSSSDFWLALLDFGTNYCNLHNLITGSGLDKMAGYSETTSNSICTQYTSSNCKIY